MAEPWESYVLDAPEPGRARDLDETRRLLYIALFTAGKPAREPYSLVGTIVNALAHHSAKVDADEAGSHLVALIEHGDPDAEAWVRAQIAKINELLGDG